VARDASQDDIRRAYRALAKKHHPDLNPGNAKAEERFKTVSAANELLSDPIKRGQFDRGEIDAAGKEQSSQPSYRAYAESESGQRYSRSGSHADGWGTGTFEDVFASIFNEDRPRGGAPLRGRDEHFLHKTDFIKAVNGATERLTLPDGRVLDVKIPPGTTEGQILRLRGLGGKGIGGDAPIAGDALIEIHIAAHRYFIRDGQDIRLDVPVSLSEAVLGGSIDVPTPGGRVRMRLPPHSDNKTELRLKGRGVPANGGLPAGDLYATVQVMLGPADAALDAFLRDWVPEHPINPRQDMEMEQ